MKYIGTIYYSSGIYMIKNLINNKIYIGSTYKLYSRFATHRYNLENNKHPNKYLQDSYNKSKCFEFLVLEIVSIDRLQEKEEFWIDYFNSNNRNKGYNLREVSESNRGINLNQETKNKISNSLTGIKRKPFTQEHKDKIGKFFKGKKLSEEHKNNISKNAPKIWMGKKLSIEIKQKMSESQKGKIVTEITKEKKSKSMRGKNSKLKEEDIIIIKTLILKGMLLKDIALQFNVSPTNISDIKREKVWKYVKI